MSMSAPDKPTERDQSDSARKPPPRVRALPHVKFTPSVRRLLGDISRTQESLREQVRRSIMPPPIAEQLRERFNRQLKTLIEPAREFAARAARQLEEAMPANWRGIDTVQFWKVMDLCETAEVAVVWVPRSEVVVKLAEAAAHAERERILVAHRGQILDDVAGALREATVNPTVAQQEARSQAIEGIEAARAGFDRAAQTLLASALGHLLEGALGFERPGTAHKRVQGARARRGRIDRAAPCLPAAEHGQRADRHEFQPPGLQSSRHSAWIAKPTVGGDDARGSAAGGRLDS
jgi:hypothetical protein